MFEDPEKEKRRAEVEQIMQRLRDPNVGNAEKKLLLAQLRSILSFGDLFFLALTLFLLDNSLGFTILLYTIFIALVLYFVANVLLNESVPVIYFAAGIVVISVHMVTFAHIMTDGKIKEDDEEDED